MSDMTIDLTKQFEKFRSPDQQETRTQLTLREVLENGVIDPKTEEPKHVYRYFRMDQFL
jgi:hypothetical protein